MSDGDAQMVPPPRKQSREGSFSLPRRFLHLEDKPEESS